MKKLIATLAVLALLLAFAGPVSAVDNWDTRYNFITTQRATGAVALAASLAPGVAFQLLEMRVHLSAASATSENLTITMDAGAGAAYDSVVYSYDMDTVADLVVTFTDRYFSSTDELDFAWANTNTRTYGIEIVYRTLY